MESEQVITKVTCQSYAKKKTIFRAYGFVQLFQLVKPTNPQEVEQKVNEQ